MTGPVLVAGGTGRLGTRVVADLADQGTPVRILTRDARRGSHLARYGADVIVGDIRDRATVQAVTEGTSMVVSAIHGFTGTSRDSLAEVDRDGNRLLIDAARDAGAGVVLMSVVGASPTSGSELFRRKAEAEAYLARTGGGTVVRATAFLELWIEILIRTAQRSGHPVVFGRGRNPINFVSAVDVAALVTKVLLEPGIRGGTYEIGGPRDLSMEELASLVASRLRQPATARHLPPGLMRAAAATVGRVRPAIRRQLLTALAMDIDDMRFAGTRAGPLQGLPCTDATSAVAAFEVPQTSRDTRAEHRSPR
jgi:uncharacterized protein YbjT (DUF2867 family)